MKWFFCNGKVKDTDNASSCTKYSSWYIMITVIIFGQDSCQLVIHSNFSLSHHLWVLMLMYVKKVIMFD